MNIKCDKKNSTFDGWTKQEKNKYFDRIKKITFKEREKEILARLRNRENTTETTENSSKIVKNDKNVFWDKDLKKLEVEKKSLKRILTPVELHGLYKNLINVHFF
jgi:hypothetical protein